MYVFGNRTVNQQSGHLQIMRFVLDVAAKGCYMLSIVDANLRLTYVSMSIAYPPVKVQKAKSSHCPFAITIIFISKPTPSPVAFNTGPTVYQYPTSRTSPPYTYFKY